MEEIIFIETRVQQEFKDWAETRGELPGLFRKWSVENFQLKFRPTIDRIDPNRGYRLDNIRWLSHSENSRLGSSGKRKGW